MKKVKTNKVGKMSQKRMDMLVEFIAQNGDRFGRDIIEMMDLKEIDPVKLGAITIGLTKAWAVVRDLGRRTGVDVETLFRTEGAHYTRQIEMFDKEK